MEAKTKKTLIIGSLVVVAAGVIGFLWWKKKKAKESETTDSTLQGSTETTPSLSPSADTGKGITKVTTTAPIKTTAPTTKPVATGIPTGVSKAQLVSAVDLLAGNPNGANQKAIYAGLDGLTIYNAKGDAVRKTKKNELLGIVSYTEKLKSGAYLLWFMNLGVKYRIPASGVLVKTN